MEHKGCGGTVFMLQSGDYWCMNCNQTFSEDEIKVEKTKTVEFIDGEIMEE